MGIWHSTAYDERCLVNEAGRVLARIRRFSNTWIYEGAEYIDEVSAKRAAEQSVGGYWSNVRSAYDLAAQALLKGRK